MAEGVKRGRAGFFSRIDYPLPADAVQDCFLRAGDCIIAAPMPKSQDPGGRKRANAVSRDRRGLLERILDTPHLAHVVPRLQPEILHKVIETCGLEDCGDLVALATPDQLQRVFDLDLWRSSATGPGRAARPASVRRVARGVDGIGRGRRRPEAHGCRHRPRDRVARLARARHGLRGRGAFHDAGRRTRWRRTSGRPTGWCA